MRPYYVKVIIATVLGNMSPADKEVDKELANLIETTVEIETGHSESGQTIFIVGPTGAGKSTFLDRFFRKTLSDALRRRCVVTRINCLDSTGREDTALNWITEVLIQSLEAIIYQDGAPSWDELQGLYRAYPVNAETHYM